MSAVQLSAVRGSKEEQIARVQQEVIATAVTQVKAHMATDAVQDALIAKAVQKATDAVINEERRIGRAHGWRGALVGAAFGAGVMGCAVWLLLGGLTQSVAFFAKVSAYEQEQDDLNHELSDKVHGK